ncbi:hypothetical protein [Haladaptatus sp. CMAA 1911]|uniref:hypothetical protein n=1 Tax=unclassified Haladaptatus TaxID=2622732 RepID=UPI0037553D8B
MTSSNTSFDSIPGLPRLRRSAHRIAPAIGLAFLSPLVGEYLLGNTSIVALVDIWFFLPIYGGGAVLIREITRRSGRGWPTVLLLGSVFGVILAGLIDHSLFHQDFQGRIVRSPAYIPAVGISAENALVFVVGHVVWSIGIPILLVESFLPERRTTPWIGKTGLVITGLLFLVFGTLLEYGIRLEEGFFPSTPQVVGTVIVAVVVSVVAFTADGRFVGRNDRQAPNPWVVGIVAFGASSLWMVRPDIVSVTTSALLIESVQEWLAVAFGILLIGAMILLIGSWSQRTDWGEIHRIALAGGAMLTYAWISFVLVPYGGVSKTVDLVGDVVFTLGAVLLIIVAARRVRRTAEEKL